MGRFFTLATILASLPFYWYSLSAAATANAFIRCQYTTGTAKSEPFSSRPLFPAPLDKQIIHHHRTDLKKARRRTAVLRRKGRATESSQEASWASGVEVQVRPSVERTCPLFMAPKIFKGSLFFCGTEPQFDSDARLLF